MDPASASAVFVGFASSLATLSALVIESSRTLYNVQRRWKGAPHEVKNLARELQQFQSLLDEVQRRVGQSPQGQSSPGFEALFADIIKSAQEDIEDFSRCLRRLLGLLDRCPTSKDRLELRIRHILQESTIQEHRRKIGSHMGALVLFLSLLGSQQIDIVSQQATRILDIATSNAVFFGRHSKLGNLTIIQQANQNNHSLPSEEVSYGRGLRNNGFEENFPLPHIHRGSREYPTPLGTVIFGTDVMSTGGSQRHIRRASTFTFIPPPWMSHLILHWNLEIADSCRCLPRLNLSLSPIRYNPNKDLKAAIESFDVAGLQKLFRSGLAGPNDCVLSRKPISLLEAFAVRADKQNCTSGYDALDMYKYLLESGCGNGDSALAPCHARVLISLTKRSPQDSEDSIGIFLSHGGNVLWRHGDSASILLLVMRHGATFERLEKHLFRQSEPWTVGELTQIDKWLIGTLAHSNPRFHDALQEYLGSYRSPFQRARSGARAMAAFDIKLILAEIGNAPSKDRIEVLRIISKWGTKAMIAPFVEAGFDFDETASNSMLPWLRLSYLSKAVRWGNPDTFSCLLAAGACPARALVYLSRYPDALRSFKSPDPKGEMIVTLAKRAEPRHLANSHDELLGLLLRTDEVRRYSPSAAAELIDKFFLQRPDIFKEIKAEIFNSYLLVAISLDLPHLLTQLCGIAVNIDWNCVIGNVLRKQRVSIEGSFTGTFSWLGFATHLGRASCAKVLIEHGADVLEKDPSGRSPLQLANEYLLGSHHRPTTALHIWPYQPRQRQVSLEDDLATLAVLQDAASVRDSVAAFGERGLSNSTPIQSPDPGDGQLNRTWSKFATFSSHLGFTTKAEAAMRFSLEMTQRFRGTINHKYRTSLLRKQAARLSKLSFTEALILRFGFVISLVALLMFEAIDILLRVANYASARGFRRFRY